MGVGVLHVAVTAEVQGSYFICARNARNITGGVIASINKQCVLKRARVGPCRLSIGTASRNENACAAFCWRGDIPTIIGRRLWRRELPLALYNVS